MLFLSGKSTKVQAQLAGAMAGGERGDGVRAGGGDPRPHPGADGGAGQPGDQSRGGRGGRRGGAAPGGRACLRAGLLHPGAPELGEPGLFPAHRFGGAAGGDPGGVPRAVLRQQDAGADDPRQPRAGQCRPADRGAERAARAEGGDRGAAARREGGAGRAGGAERARGAGAADGGEREPGGAARRARRGLRARRGAGADRGLRQQPHHGDERGRGDDRRRGRGVREVAVPQVQHQGRTSRRATTSG